MLYVLVQVAAGYVVGAGLIISFTSERKWGLICATAITCAALLR